MTQTTDEWVDRLNRAGVPCGPIYSIDQTFADPQVKRLHMAQEVPADDGREFELVAQPVTLSRTPSRIAARPPEFSEHTDEVLREFGFSAGEITALKRSGAV